MSIELGEAVGQLRSFQRRYNEAPTAILRQISDLETMSLLMRQLERHRQYDRHNTILLDSCARKCEDDIRRIRELISKITLVGMPRMSSIRFAFKQQQELRDLSEGLERSKSSLNTAILTYMVSEWSRRGLRPLDGSRAGQQELTNNGSNTGIGPSLSTERSTSSPSSVNSSTGTLQESDILVTKLVQTIEYHEARLVDLENSTQMSYNSLAFRSNVNAFHSSTALPEDDTVADANKTNVISMCTSNSLNSYPQEKRYRLRIHFPSWLINRIWDLSYMHSQVGWKLNLQIYHLVPYNADIITYTKIGDLDKIKKLLTGGKALLTDRDPGGWDPLIVSTFLSWIYSR